MKKLGGMPEAVSEHITSHENTERIRQVWQSIPSQLAKENKRFIFSAVKQGGRGCDYLAAIQFLADCGLIHKISRIWIKTGCLKNTTARLPNNMSVSN